MGLADRADRDRCHERNLVILQMKIYPNHIEIRILFFPVRYLRDEITVRRWTLVPVLIDGIEIDKRGSSPFRLFSTFRAEKLRQELAAAGYTVA